MDYWPTSSRASEDSERRRSLDSAEKRPAIPKRAAAKSPPGGVSPDGTPWTSNDDKPVQPKVRTRDDKPRMLSPEALRQFIEKDNVRVVLPRSSSLPAAPSPQSGPDRASAQSVERPMNPRSPRFRDHAKHPVWDSDELTEMAKRMRRRAMSEYDAAGDRRGNRFDVLFNGKEYAHLDHETKLEVFMGYLIPATPRFIDDDHQKKYFDEVARLYTQNCSKAGAKRLAFLMQQYDQLDTNREKRAYRARVLENLIWKLTPNQREGLRQDFKWMYGKTTIRDDTNWMFFDTIIRLHTKDEGEQRRLTEKILAAPEKTRLQERDKLLDEIHSLLTPEQRTILKRVCKERYDLLTYTRLPLLQLIIREKNELAMMDYLDAVFKYVPKERRYEFLRARSSTLKEVGDGDSAFFNIVQWGTPWMMHAFILYILRSEDLTLHEKWYLLSGFTRNGSHGRLSAFHMIMASGNLALANTYLDAIVTFLFNRDDFVDAFGPLPNERILTTKCTYFSATHYNLVVSLLQAPVYDCRRETRTISAHTRADEIGKKKCAQKFRSRVKRMDGVFTRESRLLIVGRRPIVFGDDGKMFPEEVLRGKEAAIRTAARFEKALAKEGPEVLQKWQEETKAFLQRVDDNVARNEAILKAREQARLEGRPESDDLTGEEMSFVRRAVSAREARQAQAQFAYAVRDGRVGFANYVAQRSVKRQAKLAPLKSAAKVLASPFTPDQSAGSVRLSPTSPYSRMRSPGKAAASPKPAKVPKFRMPDQFSPSRYVNYQYMERNPDGTFKAPEGPYLDHYDPLFKAWFKKYLASEKEARVKEAQAIKAQAKLKKAAAKENKTKETRTNESQGKETQAKQPAAKRNGYAQFTDESEGG